MEDSKWLEVMKELEDIIFDRYGDVKASDKIAAIKLLAKIEGRLDSKLDDLQEEVLKWLEAQNKAVEG